jgi:C-methyltransferase C-terminal domain/Methyltransferase domain
LGLRLARRGQQADLVVGNNVFAHVPDINDFARGLKEVLKPGGTINLEFPHLMQLINKFQFDTIYHEHFSYLSLYTVERIFSKAGLRVQDVELLSTHGGSLRIYGCHAEDERPTSQAVKAVLVEEARSGLRDIKIYEAFQARADRVKDELLGFLLEQKRKGKQVAAYGAAAKGNTLLNYAGVRPDLLPFVCDAAAAKQGMFMPGSHIPIVPPSRLEDQRPDYLLILPWNIAAELKAENIGLEKKGTRFVTAVPALDVL